MLGGQGIALCGSPGRVGADRVICPDNDLQCDRFYLERLDGQEGEVVDHADFLLHKGLAVTDAG
jgi:hypothetical protein